MELRFINPPILSRPAHDMVDESYPSLPFLNKGMAEAFQGHELEGLTDSLPGSISEREVRCLDTHKVQVRVPDPGFCKGFGWEVRHTIRTPGSLDSYVSLCEMLCFWL